MKCLTCDTACKCPLENEDAICEPNNVNVSKHVNSYDRLCFQCWTKASEWLKGRNNREYASTVLTPVELDEYLENNT